MSTACTNDNGQLVLNMTALWRSRDLYKAWGDNLIGISHLHRQLTERLSEKTGKEVIVGPYSEMNGSLHIYGQDYTQKGMDTFFETFPTKEDFVAKSLDSDTARDMLVLSQLEQLKTEKTWNFPLKSIEIIDKLIDDFRSGRVLV